MCGLAGLQTTDGSKPPMALLGAMQGALGHRGPDGVAKLLRGDTALLHLRLAIVDLRTGDQPLYGPDDLALVANGEIYNDPALREALGGWEWRSRSDCEPPVLLAARDGVSFADRLRGMYAIAIHDPGRGRLLLARDPFGIKPLYYAQSAGLFAFASEPQALLAAGLGTRAVDPVRRAELLQLKFTTGAETIFPGIHRVLPGETLVVERGRIVERRTRAALPAGKPVPIRPDPARAELGRVLLDGVTAHLRADVPYGLFLSGGIDSACLLALMRQATGSRIQAITVGWEGAGVADESAEAARLAGLAGADCERLVMTERDFWTLAPQIAACVDDPTADAAVLPSWLLGRAARAAGLKVALSGEGADELLGGYARYRKQRAPWRWLVRPPRSRGVLPVALPGWRDGIAASEALAGSGGRSRLQAAQAVDIAEWLPNDLLVKLDRTLMAHGVEGRTPFLDPVVAGFAFRLPDRLKASPRFGKVLLRQWLAEAFPEAGAFARKKGFKPPVGAWMQARAGLGRLVAGQPGVAEAVPEAVVRSAFALAERSPQPAYSLLFYALWHNHHVLGRAVEGTIDEVLA